MKMGILPCCLALTSLCLACSADSPMNSGTRSNPIAEGTAGSAGGAGDLGNAGSGFDFGNPDPDASIALLDATLPDAHPNCKPGTYKGTYNCMLDFNGLSGFPLMGTVTFTLSTSTTEVKGNCSPGTEFCQDLTIDKNSGKLFGIAATFFAFETSLEGGLDCKTGKFQAKAVDGVWGSPVSSNPSDPNAPQMVSQPPAGMVDGVMDGTHTGGNDAGMEAIGGTWTLTEPAAKINCPGPFEVTLQ